LICFEDESEGWVLGSSNFNVDTEQNVLYYYIQYTGKLGGNVSMDERDSIDLLAIEGFDWDDGNIHKNRLKHNVSPSECEEVIFNEPIIIVGDSEHSSEKEQRYRVLGVTTNGRRLILAITLRSNKIRVIMARDQSRKERALFEIEGKK
jgi:uncharacterized protein